MPLSHLADGARKDAERDLGSESQKQEADGVEKVKTEKES
jgi:hypothetical protein